MLPRFDDGSLTVEGHLVKDWIVIFFLFGVFRLIKELYKRQLTLPGGCHNL